MSTPNNTTTERPALTTDDIDQLTAFGGGPEVYPVRILRDVRTEAGNLIAREGARTWAVLGADEVSPGFLTILTPEHYAGVRSSTVPGRHVEVDGWPVDAVATRAAITTAPVVDNPFTYWPLLADRYAAGARKAREAHATPSVVNPERTQMSPSSFARRQAAGHMAVAHSLLDTIPAEGNPSAELAEAAYWQGYGEQAAAIEAEGAS